LSVLELLGDGLDHWRMAGVIIGVFIRRLFLHSLFARLPLKWGILLHMLWNIMCLRPAQSGSAAVVNNIAMPRGRRSKRRGGRQNVNVTTIVPYKARPRGFRPARKSKKKGKTMSPYCISRINPFMSGVNGIRAPDEFGYPTGTAVVRLSDTITSDANGYAVRLYTPQVENYTCGPFSATSGGTLTWTGASYALAPQSTALAQLAVGYRTVSWGLRITADSSLTNSQGHVWIAHVPQDMKATLWDGVPTTENQVSQMPDCEKFAITELAQQPIVVAGRAIDDGIYRFRDDAGIAITTITVESMTGWCNILVYSSGGLATTTKINIEYIAHLEYVQQGSALYGFIDTLPGPYQPQDMVVASRIDQSLPTGVFESAINTAETAVTFAGRLINVGGRAMGMMANAYAAAGRVRSMAGFLKAPHDLPRLMYNDEEKF
jgi:hypothetical protein